MVSKRGRFSNRLGFVAAAAGSAVGLGNIWKFPYETGENGGAAFLLIYLICIFLIGFPVMVAEIAMGRKAQSDPYGTYRMLGGKKWAWVGAWGIICGVMILSFYNVVAGWAFGYFVLIMFGDFIGGLSGFQIQDLLKEQNFGEFFGLYVSNYYDNLIFSLAFMVLTAIIVVRGIKGGIETEVLPSNRFQ